MYVLQIDAKVATYFRLLYYFVSLVPHLLGELQIPSVPTTYTQTQTE